MGFQFATWDEKAVGQKFDCVPWRDQTFIDVPEDRCSFGLKNFLDSDLKLLKFEKQRVELW